MPAFTKRGLCGQCNERAHLAYCDSADEYWCDSCLSNLAESQWERFNEDFHDGGSTRFTSLLQQQEAARKFK